MKRNEVEWNEIGIALELSGTLMRQLHASVCS